MTIAFTTETRALALASSTENHQRERREPCGEREEIPKQPEDLGIQIHHEKGPIQAQAHNQNKVGCQGSALDDLSLTVTNRRKLGGD